MLLYSFGIGVLMLNVISSRMSSAQECADATQITQNLTCDFRAGTCGWIKIFNPANNVNKTWRQSDGVLHAQMAYVEPANIIARIQSGLVCSTKFGSFLLQAKYTIQASSETCELSAYLVTDDDKNFTLLWRDSMVTTGAPSGVPSETFKVDIRSENMFKVVIQVKKLRDEANCDVWLGGTTFVYKDTLPTSTTTAATPVVDRKEEEGGLSGGAIAGIIVALIFVVALCVLVFLLIRRRNAGGDKQSGSLPHDANSTDTGGLESAASHHEHPDIPESSNYYSMPVEEDGTLVGGQPPVVEYSNENSAGATISTVEPGSPYYINVSDRDPSRDYWTSLQPPDEDKNLYLSLGADASSASTSKPRHGGRLEGNTSSTYLTPILDGGKCTEDASVGRTDPYENSSPKEAYVNTKAN